MMGHKGKFEVVELKYQGKRSCGIIGRQINSSGYRANVVEYIYMGESFYDDPLSTHKEPHKIMGIKTDATVIETNEKNKQSNKTEEIDVQKLNTMIEKLT